MKNRKIAKATKGKIPKPTKDKTVKATNEKTEELAFVWMDDETEQLLKVTLEYMVSQVAS